MADTFVLTPEPATHVPSRAMRIEMLKTERDAIRASRETSVLTRRDAFDLARAWRAIEAGDVPWGLQMFERVLDEVRPGWRTLA